VVAVVLAFAVGACGGDDDGAEPAPSETASNADSTGSGDTPVDDGGGIEGSPADDDLLVPREYLQGEWCDSDGQSWFIEGDTARLEDSGSGGTAELPLDLVFIDGLDVELVSQTDDEFVFGSAEDEVTFTRGRC
jgi:hypothetical protein